MYNGKEAPFFVYPNPARDEWVSFTKTADVVVINGLSEIVRVYTNTNGFDSTDLDPEVYYVKNNLGEVAKLIIK